MIHDKRTYLRTLSILLIILSLAAVAYGYRHHEFQMDFRIYYSAAEAIAKNLDPYETSNLKHLFSWQQEFPAPAVFPGIVLPLYPLIYVGFPLAKEIFVSLNIALIILVVPWFLQRSKFAISFSLKQPTWNTVFSYAAILIMLACRPTALGFSLGQLGIIVSCLLIFVLFSKNKLLSGLALAIATALKYSLTPFFGLLLLIKGQIRLCLFSFIFFIGLCLAPVLFGHSLTILYHKYLSSLLSIVGPGTWDSWGGHSIDLINLGYFTNSLPNILLFILFGFTLLIVFYREYRTNIISLELLFVISTMSLIFTYHRLYDAIIPLLALLALAIQNIDRKRWRSLIIQLSFLGYFLIPRTFIQSLFDKIDLKEGFPLYLSQYKGYTDLLPYEAIPFTILAFYSIMLYFTQTPTPLVELQSDHAKKS